MSKNEVLYSWLFHWNPITELWNAFKRSDYVKYSNGQLIEEEIIKGKDINQIIEYLNTKEDEKN